MDNICTVQLPSKKELFIKWLKKITVFDVVNHIVLLALTFLMIYPFVYMFSVSISHIDYVSKVIFLPKDPSLAVYSFVFRMPQVYLGYLNSLFYSFFGLLISMVLTTLGAYGLSQKWLPGVKFFLVIVLITMYFGGGLIPTFLLVNDLHMVNTIWAIVVPGAINTYNLIVMRSYFLTSIPQEIVESCRIDGADEVTTLVAIYLPLSTPILATISLFYFVATWNSWFSAYIYLDDEKLYPIQLVLKNALSGDGLNSGLSEAQRKMLNDRTSAKSLNYALSIAVIAPIIILFPFFQKFFVKGVMVGSIKG